MTPPLLIQHHGVYSSFISLSMFMTPSSDGEKSGSCYSKYVYLLDQSLCVSTISHYQHLLPRTDTSITQCWALMPYARQCPARVPCSGSSWQSTPCVCRLHFPTPRMLCSPAPALTYCAGLSLPIQASMGLLWYPYPTPPWAHPT